MAIQPLQSPRTTIRYRLARFAPGHAALVASWIRDEREGYWVAPQSRPPVDAAAVLSWQAPDRDGLVLLTVNDSSPVAYGEVNMLHGRPRRYWIGHLVVDPARRSQGIGRELVDRLARWAVDYRAALSVTLVVFRENIAAIRCYSAAGFCQEGLEAHAFPHYGVTENLLRMTRYR